MCPGKRTFKWTPERWTRISRTAYLRNRQAQPSTLPNGYMPAMIKDYIANSFHVDGDDFELDPFNKQGGLGKMCQLFGEETDASVELNEKLVA